ncbi:TonB-dependent siderophore receptor [Vibrio scophthalmi]|uniref:TonB-dependent siderophore receptor n=1 Tax=Vibrio scophthalmi TaxID=45658 RepID=UPI002FF3361D
MHNQTPLSVAVRKAIWLGLAPAAVVCSSAVFAQESTTELETITVTAQALKVDTPAQETPRSVSIVTEDDLRTRAPQKLDEALRYTSGVTAQPYGADNDTDWFRVRGFEAASYLDGSRLHRDGYYTWLLEPYALEQVEVVKGPSAILFGETAPGGVVNAVQKKPTLVPQGEVRLELGNNNTQGIAFDISDHASEDGSVRYRLVGMMKSADGELDETENTRFYLAPSLEIDVSERTSLTLLASYLEDDGVPTNPFMPAYGTLLDSEKGHIDPSTNLGEPDYDTYQRKQISLGYLLEHNLNQDWTLNQTFNYGYNELYLISSYIFSTPYWLDNDLYDRGMVYRDGVNQSLTLDTNAVGNWFSGLNEHTVMVGLDLQYHNTDGKEETGFGMDNIDPIDPWNPTYGNYTPITDSDLIDRTIDKTLIGLYSQYQLNVASKWIGQVGARYDWYDVENKSVQGNEYDSMSDGQLSLNAGLMYLSDSGLSPYISYAQGFEVLSTLNGVWGQPSEDKELYKPRESEQFEVGIKYEPSFFDGYANLAWFDITNKNALTQSSNSANMIQTGEMAATGVELEVVGYITDEVKLSAAYTYVDATIDSQDDGNAIPAPLIPKHQATAWVDYDASTTLLPDLYLGSGLRYIGESKNDKAAEAYVPHSTVPDVLLWDLAATYDITRQWQAQLNVNNVLDKEYIAGCDWYCYYGQSRTVMLNANYRW